MSGITFKDNAYGTITSSLSSTDPRTIGAVSITLTAGHGARFPSAGSGTFFPFTLISQSNKVEHFICIQRVNDTLDAFGISSTHSNFAPGDFIECRLNSAVMGEFDQVGGTRTYLGTAGGTANAVTASLPSVRTSLVDGITVVMSASGANTAAMSFRLDYDASAYGGTVTTGVALNVYKHNQSKTEAGDVPAAGYQVVLRYNASWNAWVLLNPAKPALPTGFRRGLITSYVSASSVAVSAGVCRDDTDTYDIRLPSATNCVLQTTGSWTAGDGGNKLDTGVKGIAITIYHTWAIRKTDGTADILISTSPTAPTMPAGYTIKRRIRGGSFRLDNSGNILPFDYDGEGTTMYRTMVNDVAGLANSNTAVTVSTSVPTGLSFGWIGVVHFTNDAGANPAFALLSSLAQADVAPTAVTASDIYARDANSARTIVKRVPTNTLGQMRWRVSSNAGNYWVNTQGYFDYGQD